MYHYVYARSQFPEISHFFFGFFCIRWDGIVMLAPMVKVDEQHIYNPVTMYILEHVIAVYFPKALLIPKTIGVDINLLSHDKKMAEFMSKDPLIFPFGPRPATGIQLVKSSIFVQRNMSIIGDIDIPLLVFHGTADPTTKSASSMELVEKVTAGRKNKDARYTEKEGAYHRLLVDQCRYEIYDEIVEWMDNHNNKSDATEKEM